MSTMFKRCTPIFLIIIQKVLFIISDYYSESPFYNHPDFLPLYEKEKPFKVILTLDGDYMKMYIDEISEDNLFQILVRTTPEACDQIEKWIKGESYDLSKVVMPRSSSVGKTMLSLCCGQAPV